MTVLITLLGFFVGVGVGCLLATWLMARSKGRFPRPLPEVMQDGDRP